MFTMEVATRTEDSTSWSGILGLCPQDEQNGSSCETFDENGVSEALAHEEQRLLQRNTLPYEIYD
jgi:hypothetical protein